MKQTLILLAALAVACGTPVDLKEIEINVELQDTEDDVSTVVDAVQSNCDGDPEEFYDSFLRAFIQPVIAVQQAQGGGGGGAQQIRDLYAVLDSVEFSFEPVAQTIALEYTDPDGAINSVEIDPTPIAKFVARPNGRTNFAVNEISETLVPFITIERKNAWYAETLKRYNARVQDLDVSQAPSFPTTEYNYVANFRFLEDVNSTEDAPTTFREIKHRGSFIIGNYDRCG